MVDNETFYVTAQDQKKVIGPVTRTQITAALKQGKLKPNHLVSHSQEGPWQTLQEVFASASNQSPSVDKQKQPEPISYYLKRGETIRGPLERAAILQAAKGRMLMTGDQIANSKDGPWQDVTKEQLQQLQQESDKEHVTAPPRDRAELKKWLQANKDESSVSCPHCSASVKHSNLLQHCDKLHYSRLSTTNSSLPASQAATKKSAGKSKNPTVSVTRYPKNVEELERWMNKNCPLVGLSGRRQPESIKCPHCDEIVASRKLVNHCIKFHFEPKDRKVEPKDRKAVLKLAFALAIPALALLVLIALGIAGVWGLPRIGGWLLELATQGWANSGAFRVVVVCVGVAVTIGLVVTLGVKSVLFILGTAYFVFCCWCMYAIVAFVFPSEGTLEWFRTFAGAGFATFFLFSIALGAFGWVSDLGKMISKDDNDSEAEDFATFLFMVPLVIGFICFAIGGIGATFLWLYSG
jgi:hypothetical protein